MVEFFWAVRRSEKAEECNMELVDLQSVSGVGMQLQGNRRVTRAAAPVRIPVMRSSKDLAAGDELVCHYVEEGERAVKRARVT